MTSAVLRISGMSCQHCVHTIASALQNVTGVTRAAVDLSRGRGTVEYDALQTSASALANIVMDEGYAAEEVA